MSGAAMIGRAMLLLALLWMAAIPAHAQEVGRQEPGRKVALVIANANYTTGGILANPLNDAKIIAESLRRTGLSPSRYHPI